MIFLIILQQTRLEEKMCPYWLHSGWITCIKNFCGNVGSYDNVSLRGEGWPRIKKNKVFQSQKYFSFMWTIFKVFIEFVTILLLFNILAFWPQRMWDPSSPNRDWACTPSLEGKVLTTGLPGKSLESGVLIIMASCKF